MKIPFTITRDNISMMYKGKIYNIPSTHTSFDAIKEHLKLEDHSQDFIESIVEVKQLIEKWSRGNVKIAGNEVFYKNQPVHNALANRLYELFDEGFDITPWSNFMEKVMTNPSQDAKDRLFIFLEKNQSPITPDGDFITFKRIRPDWTDIYTGKFDNRIGTIVEVDRLEVNPDNSVTCSHGLHVAASHYLDKGPTDFSNTLNSRTIVCKVNPADVVAVPSDYKETKMRVCRYEVISEVEDNAIGSIIKVENQKNFGEFAKSDISKTIEPNNDIVFDKRSDTEKKLAKILGNSNQEVKYDVKTENVFFYVDPKFFKRFGNIFLEHVEDKFYKSYEPELCDVRIGGCFVVIRNEENDELFYDIKYDSFSDKFGIDSYTIGCVTDIKLYGKKWSEYVDMVYDVLDANGYKFKICGKPKAHSGVNENVKHAESSDELTFIRNGRTFTESEITHGVANFGSVAAWARSVDVPRSTAQDWVKKIIR